MKTFYFIFIVSVLCSQSYSDYYIKFYSASYSEIDKFFNEDYESITAKNGFTFNTYSLDAIYRFTPTWQLRVLIPFVNVENDLPPSGNRNGFTDLWTEVHYYFSQYPNKRYVGFGLKLPLGYDEAPDPWLSDGANEIRFRYLIKNQLNPNYDYEFDLSIDYTLNESDRVNSGGIRIPYFLSMSYYYDEFTFLGAFSGSFKSFEYGSPGSYGDAYNQFSVEIGSIIKYKFDSDIELELSYLRTVYGFQVPVANHFGLGISFGIRD
jgi:hypothetical protein